ncbi:MAG: phytanoyl-CoA dioxygenase family protein [Armatimonadetes bacterium]|nr:phytanoyl-CoA dioxygenase family protein [Armatimonadota bacterium]
MDVYPLTEQQIAFFRENGFVQLDNVLTPDELEELRRAADEVLAQRYDVHIELSAANPDYEKVFVQKLNLWLLHDGIRKYTLHPRLAEIARRLLGVRRVRLWHDHLLTKMPGDSKPSPWHQDRPYWSMSGYDQVSCWLALDDVDEHNGCMQFIPGSHLWGELEPIDLVHPKDIFALVPDKEPREPYIARLKAGSCTFHHGLTFHYAGANHSDRPRRAFVIIYMADGARYTGKPHVITDRLSLQPGQLFEGELYPILAEGD